MSARTDLISSLPDTVATAIKLVLPGLFECKGITGRFNLERLKSESVKAPAVLVAALGIRQGDMMAGRVHQFRLEMAAFIITKDALGLPRDVAAANICHAISKIVPDNTWGDNDCGEATQMVAQPIVGSEVRGAKAGLWAVTWQQPCVLDFPDPAAVVPIELYLGQSPNIGSANQGSYDKIGGP